MHSFKIARVGLVCLSVILSACAPQYRTFYEYKPISSPSDRQCVNGCLVIKQQCEATAIASYNSCETRAEIAYQACEGRKVYGYDDKGNWTCLYNCFCLRDSCTNYAANCEEPYKDCYVNCGGTVVATTQCVQNCEKAAPPSVVVYGEKPVAKKATTNVIQSKKKEESSGKKAPPQNADEKLKSMTEDMASQGK